MLEIEEEEGKGREGEGKGKRKGREGKRRGLDVMGERNERAQVCE